MGGRPGRDRLADRLDLLTAAMPGGIDFRALVEASPSLAEPLVGLDRAAASRAPVLVLGESGTGRSTVAQVIHAASERSGEPLVDVDIAALPASLVESELFGYRRGAFTGADRSVDGRIAIAEGGSLLLDQVEEIPLDVQPKLLRVLAEGTFAPLGGGERQADVRFLAIGASDLHDRVERGHFRRDLFHRMEVLTFRVPPLRERLDDLPQLTGALLRDLGERFGLREPRLHEGSLEWMREYDWPGNVRQLRNLLERAIVLGDGGVVEPEPPRDREEAPKSLLELEREAIRRALRATRGHQGRAAEILGISRKALWAKRRRHGLR